MTDNLPELRSDANVAYATDNAILLDTTKFEQAQRVANLFAKCDLVPKHYQGSLPNCFIALQISVRMGIDPFMYMQNSYIVHGRPGIESKLMIALANKYGPFKSGIKFQYSGEGAKRSCTAWATLRDGGERIEQSCSMEIAKAEGWLSKPGSKWLTMPDLMLAYRSAAFLIRLYCPEVIMGLRTVEELHEAPAPTPEPAGKTAALNAIVSQTAEIVDTTTGEVIEVKTEPKKQPSKQIKSRYLSEREPEAGKEVSLNGSEESSASQGQV